MDAKQCIFRNLNNPFSKKIYNSNLNKSLYYTLRCILQIVFFHFVRFNVSDGNVTMAIVGSSSVNVDSMYCIRPLNLRKFSEPTACLRDLCFSA